MANDKLRIMLWNVENLFLFLDNYKNENLKQLSEIEWQKLSNASTPNKSLQKLWGLKDAIDDIDPDLLMVNEVGGIESLENFNSIFLGANYEVKIIEGNSDRGIDVGFLVKKKLHLESHIFTNKDKLIDLVYPHEKESANYYLSRDISELHLSDAKQNKKFIFLLTHLKSKLDPKNIDKEGIIRRTAEAKLLAQTYLQRQKECPKIPILVCGDFNGVLSDPAHSEFQFLRDNTQLVDSMNYSLKDAQSDRVTQIQFRFQRRFHYQFDYILLDPRFAERIVPEESYIFYFKDKTTGANKPLPASLEERLRLPSDHYPVVLTLQPPDHDN